MMWAAATTLLTIGAAIGAIAGQLASSPSLPWLDSRVVDTARGHAPPSSTAPHSPRTATADQGVDPPGQTAMPAGSSLPAASATQAPPAGAAAEVRWSEPRVLRLPVSPTDIALSDDGNTVYVLGQDASLRAFSVDGGREERRIALPKSPSAIRLLGGRYLVTLGDGPTLIIDLSSRAAAKVDPGGAVVEAVAVGDGRALVLASAEGGRVARYVPDKGGVWRIDGEFTLTRPPVAMTVAGTEDKQLLAILTQPARRGARGSLELLDPGAVAFGGVRLTFAASFDAGATALPARGGFTIVDRGGAQLLRVSPDAPMEIVSAGPAARGGALGAYRLLDRYIVVVDAAGAATVVSEPDGAVVSTLALEGKPADAATTSDGRAVLIALGGGAGGRGKQTVVVSGDPPAITDRFDTGAGSLSVAVSATGRRTAIAAFWARTVTILDPR